VLGARAVWTPKLQPTKTTIARSFYMPSCRVLFVASEYMARSLDYTEACIQDPLIFTYIRRCSLGVQFSFLVGRVFSQHLWFRFAALVFYIALPAAAGLGLCRTSPLAKQSRVPDHAGFPG